MLKSSYSQRYLILRVWVYEKTTRGKLQQFFHIVAALLGKLGPGDTHFLGLVSHLTMDTVKAIHQSVLLLYFYALLLKETL